MCYHLVTMISKKQKKHVDHSDETFVSAVAGSFLVGTLFPAAGIAGLIAGGVLGGFIGREVNKAHD